jgi:hypothetical protein
MSALRVDSCATHQVIKLKVLWKELHPEPFSEPLKFEAFKILGEDISSVIFRGDKEHIDLLLSHALTHVMILDINMFHVDLLHRIRPNENAALIVCVHWYWCKTHTKFKEYIADLAHLMEAIR